MMCGIGLKKHRSRSQPLVRETRHQQDHSNLKRLSTMAYNVVGRWAYTMRYSSLRKIYHTPQPTSSAGVA